MVNGLNPEKAKPFVRRGRKAVGPAKGGMAELPKDEPKVVRLFFRLGFF
jgi:hypothetical protein